MTSRRSGPFLLMDDQPDVHLLGRPGVGKRSGLQVRGIELDGRQQRSALGDFEYGVGGALHGRGVAIPTDLQLSLAIDGAESQRGRRRPERERAAGAGRIAGRVPAAATSPGSEKQRRECPGWPRRQSPPPSIAGWPPGSRSGIWEQAIRQRRAPAKGSAAPARRGTAAGTGAATAPPRGGLPVTRLGNRVRAEAARRIVVRRRCGGHSRRASAGRAARPGCPPGRRRSACTLPSAWRKKNPMRVGWKVCGFITSATCQGSGKKRLVDLQIGFGQKNLAARVGVIPPHRTPPAGVVRVGGKQFRQPRFIRRRQGEGRPVGMLAIERGIVADDQTAVVETCRAGSRRFPRRPAAGRKTRPSPPTGYRPKRAPRYSIVKGHSGTLQVIDVLSVPLSVICRLLLLLIVGDPARREISSVRKPHAC